MNKLAVLAKASSRDLLILLGVVAVFSLIPLGVSPFMVSIATGVLILAMAGVGWNVLSGFAGQFSFGHAAYFGLGAYGAGLALKHLAVPMSVAIAIAPLAALAGALLFGWFCVRLSGVYLAMLSLAFAEVVVELRAIENAIEREAVAIADTFYNLQRFDIEGTRETRTVLIDSLEVTQEIAPGIDHGLLDDGKLPQLLLVESMVTETVITLIDPLEGLHCIAGAVQGDKSS